MKSRLTHKPMLNLYTLPATVYLDGRQHAALTSLVSRMRACGAAYEADSASSVIVAASEVFPSSPYGDDLLAIVVDLPSRLKPDVQDWLSSTPEVDCYHGSWQDLRTCLRFTTPAGASLCVDIEALSDSILHDNWHPSRMLLCLAYEDQVSVAQLDARILADPKFADALYDHCRTAAEDRDNLSYALRKGYREVDYVERPQGRDQPVCVVPWALGLNEVRCVPLEA